MITATFTVVEGSNLLSNFIQHIIEDFFDKISHIEVKEI